MRQIGEEQRAINEIQAKLNAKVDELKSKAMSEAEPYQKKIPRLVEGFFVFAEANREDLANGGKRKTVYLPIVIFGWLIGPPTISLRNAKKMLKTIKAIGLVALLESRKR